MKLKLKRLSILICSFLFTKEVKADDHDHLHDDFEIGMMIGRAYILDGSYHSALSIHGHAVWFIPNTVVGFGIGYERLFDKHKHQTLSAISQINIWKGWSVIMAPGFTWDDDKEFSASIHVETTYEFEVNDYLHVGPVIELALDKHAPHFTPGLHVGVLF